MKTLNVSSSNSDLMSSIIKVATLIIDDIKSELDDDTFNVFINLLDFLNNQIIFSCIDDHFSSKIVDKYNDFKKFHVEQLR